MHGCTNAADAGCGGAAQQSRAFPPSRQLLLHCPTFRHLTARDGGNARRLLGAIFALSVAWKSDSHDSTDGGGRTASGTAVEDVRAAFSTIAPALFYLPTSDRQGWWKCKGIVGTILALSVACARGINASDLQERRKCRRIVGNNPCHARQNDPCPALTSNSQLSCLRPFGLFHFCATPRTNGPA